MISVLDNLLYKTLETKSSIILRKLIDLRTPTISCADGTFRPTIFYNLLPTLLWEGTSS